MQSTKIKFWGVRGSIPTPGPRTLRYGGNTACLEIQFPNKPRFILDAGSGIRELGKELLKIQDPITAYVFISHFHWDHIQGLPFFKPVYKPGNKFIIYGCDEPDFRLHDIISFQMKPTYFPLAVEDMKAQIEFRPILEQTFTVEGVKVKTKLLNHPGYALGYRFEYGGKSIIYISDNEPFYQLFHNQPLRYSQADNIDLIFEKFFEDKDKEMLEFIRNADVLIHDTQFLPEEYSQRVTWGHSPYNYTVDLAIGANAKRLVLFHHDPDHDDDTIEEILKLSRKRLEKYNHPIACIAAKEGETLEI